MKLMDSHYCPMCGNLLPDDNAKLCLHCATPIDRPQPDHPKSGGCLTTVVLAIFLVAAFLLRAR